MIQPNSDAVVKTTMDTGKINVCHIISGDLWGGAEAQAFTLIQELNKSSKNRISVITFNDGLLAEKLTKYRVKTFILHEKAHNNLKMIFRMSQIFREEKVNLIHTHGYKETFLSGFAARFSGVKNIVRTHHGKGIIEGKFRHRLIEKINAYLFCDKLISVSEDLKKSLIAKKLGDCSIEVIHNGIQLDEVRSGKPICEVKKELDIPCEAFCIGTLGRMVKVKGHRFFIEGAQRVIAKNPNIYFIIAGDGPLMGEAYNYIERSGIGRNVKLVGFRNDPYDVINSFDIFALTSLHEGIPMVLLEAMCLRKPVISTNVGGIPEIIKNGFNGMLIDPGDSERFADACFKLIDNKELQNKLCQNAYNDIYYNYSSISVADKVCSVYYRNK